MRESVKRGLASSRKRRPTRPEEIPSAHRFDLFDLQRQALGGDGKGGLDLGRDMIANDAKEGGKLSRFGRFLGRPDQSSARRNSGPWILSS
jgi:hypothetical protein